MRHLIAIAVVAAAFCHAAAAQTRADTVKIFVWDNDAGEAVQEQPAVMMSPELDCYAVWADLRDGNFNIYGQRTTYDGEPLGGNFLVNANPAATWGSEKNPDISAIGGSKGRFAVVWQDSLASGQWRIYGRLFSTDCTPASTVDLQLSYGGAAPKYRPRVAMQVGTGNFAVVWAQYRTPTNLSDIYIRLFDPDGNAISDTVRVNNVDTLRLQRRPCVAFTNNSIIVAWEDWKNGDFPVIWAQKFQPNLARVGVNYAVSNTDYWSEFPDIDAVDNTGFHVFAWHDRATGAARNVKARRASATGWIDQEFIVNPMLLLNHSYNPTVAVLSLEDCVVAWHDSVSPERSAETFVRYCYPASAAIDTGNYFLANEEDYRNQEYPDIASYNGQFTVVWHDSVRPTGRGDIMGQNGYLVTSASPDTIRKFHANQRISNMRNAGRKVWYRPGKNYDNPLTPWNEDPIAEPDSMYIPLDSAFVRAFAERNNVPGQSFVRITDSPILMEDYHDDQKSSINGGDYDACVMDLGYARDALAAGEISDTQQDSLKAFADS
ncbi:MAG: hypothetical protein MUF78_07955, partial [Candidatus Edwardsbacteria bacterium]|nr:hypothetical protein [Candidatus Edwardsbacteria bacterium]